MHSTVRDMHSLTLLFNTDRWIREYPTSQSMIIHVYRPFPAPCSTHHPSYNKSCAASPSTARRAGADRTQYVYATRIGDWSAGRKGPAQPEGLGHRRTQKLQKLSKCVQAELTLPVHMETPAGTKSLRVQGLCLDTAVNGVTVSAVSKECSRYTMQPAAQKVGMCIQRRGMGLNGHSRVDHDTFPIYAYFVGCYGTNSLQSVAGREAGCASAQQRPQRPV